MCRRFRSNKKACVYYHTIRCLKGRPQCRKRCHTGFKLSKRHSCKCIPKINKTHRCRRQAASMCRRFRSNKKACVSYHTIRCLKGRPQCRKRCRFGFKLSKWHYCKCIPKFNQSHRCHRQAARRCRRSSRSKVCLKIFTRHCRKKSV